MTRRSVRPSPMIYVFAALLLATPLISNPAEAKSGVAWLKVGVGARAMALGNAVVSHVDGPDATYWNPGALAFVAGTQAELMHNESFQSVRYEFATLTHQVGRHGFGAAFHGVWTDNLRGYDEAGTFQGEFGYGAMALTGTYGMAVTEKLGVGIGVEYIRDQIDVDVASGVAFNFGVQYREVLPRTNVGASILHLGSKLSYIEEEFDLPQSFQVGASHDIPIKALDGRARFVAEVRSIRDEDTRGLFGAEYEYREMARLQFGYQTKPDDQTQDVSFGFGVGRDKVQGEYAFAPFGDNLGDQHRFSVRLAW